MSVAGAIGALRAAVVCSRSKAVQALAAIVLEELSGWTELEAPEATGPLTPAERARRYREERKRRNGERDEASRNVTASVTENVTVVTQVSPAPSPSPSSPGFLLSLTDSQDLKGSGSGESTGARDPSSGIHRVTNRATRVPRSDATPEQVEEFARKWDIDTKDPAWPEFLDFWRSASGKGSAKLDWAATWRNRKRVVSGTQGEPRRYPANNVQPAPATGRIWKVGQ